MTPFNDRLRSVFSDVFDTTPDAIDQEMSVNTSPEWDSMRSIVLATSLETEFEIEFTDDELIHLDSYAKVRDALVRKGAG